MSDSSERARRRAEPERADDLALERALRAHGAGLPRFAGPDCPDANTMAGFLDASLLAEEERLVRLHLRGCDACRELVGGARAAPSEGSSGEQTTSPEEKRALTRRRAAGALLAAGLLAGTFALFRGLSRPSSGSGEAPEARLARVAEELAARRPDLFGDFRPLSAVELGALALARVERSADAPAALSPRGTILDLRPVFRWSVSTDSAPLEIKLCTQQGALLWSRTVVEPGARELGFPEDAAPLAEGQTYLWYVSRADQRSAPKGAADFRVASRRDREQFLSALEEIDRAVPESARELLGAHLALRRNLYAEAGAAARAALARDPEDPAARAVHEAIELILGPP